MSKYYSKTEKVFQKMEGTNQSILSLKNLVDMKKKVLFTLNIFMKPFGWVVFFL